MMDEVSKEINRQGLGIENNGWIVRSARQKGSCLPLPILFSGEIKYDSLDRKLGLTRYFCPIGEPWDCNMN